MDDPKIERMESTGLRPNETAEAEHAKSFVVVFADTELTIAIEAETAEDAMAAAVKRLSKIAEFGDGHVTVIKEGDDVPRSPLMSLAVTVAEMISAAKKTGMTASTFILFQPVLEKQLQAIIAR